MEQKKIKKNMAEGLFRIEQGSIVSQVEDRAYGVVCALPNYGSTKYKLECTANAEAICHAVNNTYGNKIDPTKVPEIISLLPSVLILLRQADFDNTATRLELLINAAKL